MQFAAHYPSCGKICILICTPQRIYPARLRCYAIQCGTGSTSNISLVAIAAGDGRRTTWLHARPLYGGHNNFLSVAINNGCSAGCSKNSISVCSVARRERSYIYLKQLAMQNNRETPPRTLDSSCIWRTQDSTQVGGVFACVLLRLVHCSKTAQFPYFLYCKLISQNSVEND